jgi:hypothetical protein
MPSSVRQNIGLWGGMGMLKFGSQNRVAQNLKITDDGKRRRNFRNV